MTTDTDLAALAVKHIKSPCCNEEILPYCVGCGEPMRHEIRGVETENLAALARVIVDLAVQNEQARLFVAELRASYDGARIDMQRAENERDAARAERDEYKAMYHEECAKLSACKDDIPILRADLDAVKRERDEARELLETEEAKVLGAGRTIEKLWDERDALRAKIAAFQSEIAEAIGFSEGVDDISGALVRVAAALRAELEQVKRERDALKARVNDGPSGRALREAERQFELSMSAAHRDACRERDALRARVAELEYERGAWLGQANPPDKIMADSPGLAPHVNCPWERVGIKELARMFVDVEDGNIGRYWNELDHEKQASMINSMQRFCDRVTGKERSDAT